MSRRALAACLLTLVFAPAANSSSAGQRCDEHTARASMADCFSGTYHGTGFLPMEETISFHAVSASALRSNTLWLLWIADAKRSGTGAPCANSNAVAYTGSFSFYGGGSFIACSQTAPNLLSGFYKVRARFEFNEGGTRATLTHGGLSGSAASDRVLELVFSDAAHRGYAQPEVVFGPVR